MSKRKMSRTRANFERALNKERAVTDLDRQRIEAGWKDGTPIMIQNHWRRWWQFWKPRLVAGVWMDPRISPRERLVRNVTANNALLQMLKASR